MKGVLGEWWETALCVVIAFKAQSIRCSLFYFYNNTLQAPCVHITALSFNVSVSWAVGINRSSGEVWFGVIWAHSEGFGGGNVCANVLTGLKKYFTKNNFSVITRRGFFIFILLFPYKIQISAFLRPRLRLLWPFENELAISLSFR